MLKLYYASTAVFEKEGVFEHFMEKVNEQRRRKVLRCKNEEDKQCSLLVGVLLRYALEQSGYDYEKLDFFVTPEGKPMQNDVPELFFSLSHSGNYAVCIISDREVGVDLEWKNRKQLEPGREEGLGAIAKKVFSFQEYEEYISASEEAKKEMFLKYWTRKEAMGKALGKGLAMDFSKINGLDENFLSFWLKEEYYVSIYGETGLDRKELEICMMN